MANPGDSSGFRCGGRMFEASEIALIREVVDTCRGLSRKELANTVCGGEWKRLARCASSGSLTRSRGNGFANWSAAITPWATKSPSVHTSSI